VRADEPARVAHPDLRSGLHDPRALEARRVRSEELQVGDHPAARLELDAREVVDVDAAVAGQPRAEEQRGVVAPADVRPLEVAERLATALHQRAVRLGL
jgi:hypothetical protein